MLPTNKLYKTMSLTEYNQALAPYVAGLASGYIDKSIPERWDIVMMRMKRLAPHMSDKLETFRRSRKGTNASLFNLSLADCLDYFENYAFLYETEDERFRLSEHQRAKLLEGIDDAMGTCETGINTRFELVLQQFRTDLNWVTNILAKYRYQLIIGLQDAYNNQFDIEDVLKTHTLKRMMHLASKPYGIAIEHSIMDAFAHLTDRSNIADYFQQNAPKIFRNDYQEQVVEILAQDLLLKIKALYCPEECDWAKTELVINQADVYEFKKFVVENRLDLPPNTIYRLGTLDEADDDIESERVPTYNFHVKKQGEMLEVLRYLIQQKLYREHYFVSFADLTRENSSLLGELGLRSSKVNELVELREAFDAAVPHPAKLRLLLQQNARIILQYPELLVRMIEIHPGMIKYIPRMLTNNLGFIQKIMNPLIGLMKAKRNEQDNRHYLEFLRCITSFLRRPEITVKFVKDDLFIDPSFSLHLMQQNGLLFSSLPENMKQQEDIIEAAVRQNPFALLMIPEHLQPLYETLALQHPIFKELNWTHNFKGAVEFIYREQYLLLSRSFPQEFPDPDSETFQNLFNQPQLLSYAMEEVAAFTQLTAETVNLSLAKMSKMTHFLSPKQLMAIMEFRELYGVPRLPYCNQKMLNNFLSSIEASGLNFNTDDTDLLRMEASQRLLVNPNEDIYEDSVIGCLAKTDNWFLAMVHYQNSTTGAFKTKRQAWLQFKKMLAELSDALFSMLKLVLGTFFLFELYISIDLLATSLLFSTLGIWLGGIFVIGLLTPFFLSQYDAHNPTLYTGLFAFGVLSYLILLPLPTVLGVLAYFAITELMTIAESSLAFFLSTLSFLGRSLQTLFSRHDYVLQQTSDLHVNCENSITRLELMENTSAQEKAELMSDVLTQVDEDLSPLQTKGEGQRNRELAQGLLKPYKVEFSGKPHFFSFYQAAALERSNSQPLDVDLKDIGCFRFFRTTTSSFLPDQTELRAISDCPKNI